MRRRRLLGDLGQRRLEPLARGEHAELFALARAQVVEREAPEDVVDQRGRDAQIGVVGHARRLELHVGVLPHVRRQGHTVLRVRG